MANKKPRINAHNPKPDMAERLRGMKKLRRPIRHVSQERQTMSETKMQAALFLMNKSQISILECEALAKDLGPDMTGPMTFDLVGPKGSKSCKWIDPHYGIFECDGKTMHTKQVQYVWDVHVENVSMERS